MEKEGSEKPKAKSQKGFNNPQRLPSNFCTQFLTFFTSPLFAFGFSLIAFIGISLFANSQTSSPYKPKTTRILFVLDGSGSMKEKWGDKEKWEIAHSLLIKMMDSIRQANPKIEMGIRIFGHQSPKSAHDCKDSKLEVPFSQKNIKEIDKLLSAIEPKGYTPIAYSIFLSAQDFPADKDSKNAIILITDGLETCNGDICAAGRALQDKRISLKPFIIGLGLKAKEQKEFDCVGTYFDASTETGFKDALTRAVSQSLETTTAQINLLDENGKPTQTNIEITMYDSHSGALLYDFVHALNDAGRPDTLRLDPIGRYDVIAHTIPPVTKKGIELIPGLHNIIALNTPQGKLYLKEEPSSRNISSLQCVIHQSGSKKTLYLQQFGSNVEYLTGTYDLEVLSLPRLTYRVEIKQGKAKEIVVPQPGILNLVFSKKGHGGIYRMNNGEMELVYEFGEINAKEILELLPGKYTFIYQTENAKVAAETVKEDFYISSGNPTTVKQ